MPTHLASSCPERPTQQGLSMQPAAQACSARQCAAAAPAQAARNQFALARQTRCNTPGNLCRGRPNLHRLPIELRSTTTCSSHLLGRLLLGRLLVVHLCGRLQPPPRGAPPPRHVAPDAAHAALHRHIGGWVGELCPLAHDWRASSVSCSAGSWVSTGTHRMRALCVLPLCRAYPRPMP